MRRKLRQLWGEQAGLATVEYALLLGLVAVAAFWAWRHLSWMVRWIVWVSAYLVGRKPDW